MGREQIYYKLQKELEKDVLEESQVVYILSKIRKLLEIYKIQGKYKFLNFYCNWAFHSKIDRTEKVSKILIDFINGNQRERFLTFKEFISELKTFLEEFELPTKIIEIEKNYYHFLNILLDIYSETPLSVYSEKKKIIIRKPDEEIKNSPFSIAFEIHELSDSLTF